MAPTDARTGRAAPRLGALRAGLVAIAMALVASACLPLVSPPTSGRTYGMGPLEAVWEAAQGQSKCSGLTSAELAVMMLVPTYPETGGPVPSPMALGRWDNLSVSSSNARLFSFQQTNGAYLGAYWTAGVGLWQFDGAGGWDLTAADAIDSLTAARQAASTISFRYCNPPSSVARDDASLRRYSWGPWYGCGTSSGWNCEQLYQSMYEGEQFDVGTDAGVSRFGGMEQRTCDVAGLGSGLTCWYVDPMRAQGSTGGWRSGTYDPSRTNWLTPLPKPFYVVRANGREHRFWIQADTGYDIGITGHKRVTANPRTAGELVWERSAPLCDRTAGRGQCATQARVASTPSGPRTADPIGSLDTATPLSDGRARITGWAIDPDTNDPIDVHLYVDGGWGAATRADVSRPDIAAAIPGYGDRHGFDATIGVGAGTHTVCAYAINVGPHGTANPNLGCRQVTVSGEPRGNLEVATGADGGLRVRGWALDPDTSGPIDVHVYVDGAWGGAVTASRPRADVGAAHPRLGPNHGFEALIPSPSGTRRACAYAINVGPNGSTNPLIGCASGTVPADPFGNWEGLWSTAGGVRVSGWAMDNDTSDATVQVRVDGVLAATLPTGTSRPDVAADHPGRGSAHGFDATVAAAPGTRQVCATLVNQGPGASRSLGCRTATVTTGNPFGNFEGAQRTATGVRISGWAIDPDTTGAVSIHVYVNGAYAGAVPADRDRPDVGAFFGGYGPRHGFDADVTAPPGATICAFALNAGPGTANTLLGCRGA